MTRRNFLSFTVSALTAAFLALQGVPSAHASAATTPEGFIDSLAERAIESLTDKSVERPQRIQRFRALFTDHFAVKGIGKWVLGRYWRKATDTEKSDYLTLFEDLMVVSYVDRFATYAGERLAIKKTLPDNDTLSTVYSEIKRPGAGQPIRVDWRVSKAKSGGFKIVDVMVEGTSMSATLRSDFKSIIRQNGGKIAGLISALRKKTSALKAESAAAN